MKKKMPLTRQLRRGRPTLFEGDRVRMSLKLTTDAKKMVDDTRDQLVARGHGHAATEGAAVEFLIRKAHLRKGGVMHELPTEEVRDNGAPSRESLGRLDMSHKLA